MKLSNTVLYRLKKFIQTQEAKINGKQEEKDIKEYFENGQIPWSAGYALHKKKSIIESINNHNILEKFSNEPKLEKFGYRIDERIVEYPWIFEHLAESGSKLLDAGSTFNFEYIIEHPLISEKELTIFTYAPESDNYPEKRISYVYGDLRELPFKDSFFDMVVSQSTIEHIDMNNSIYGYEIDHHKKSEIKSYKFLEAIKEMIRVLKPEGTLLITFPYGKFENHVFFQQFDQEMLGKLINEFYLRGSYSSDFFKYLPDGWYSCLETECRQMVSYNPHTNKGKGDDGAAHCRSICCVKFIKNK